MLTTGIDAAGSSCNALSNYYGIYAERFTTVSFELGKCWRKQLWKSLNLQMSSVSVGFQLPISNTLSETVIIYTVTLIIRTTGQSKSWINNVCVCICSQKMKKHKTLGQSGKQKYNTHNYILRNFYFCISLPNSNILISFLWTYILRHTCILIKNKYTNQNH